MQPAQSSFENGEPDEPPDCRRTRPGLVDACACRSSAGICAEFPRSARAPDHPLRAGRHRRFCRPRAGAEDRRGAWPDGGAGEQARRRRHRRCRLRRSFSAGRLQHGADGSGHRRQSDAAENDALRHLQGPGDALGRQLLARGSGGRAAARHQDLCRAGRLRQSQSRQAQLCQRRRRHHAASRRRNVEIAHRHRRRACAL